MLPEFSGQVGSETLVPFPPDSAMRRMHSESVLLLGGGRAVLMQIAHPGVAAGVAGHSSYRSQRWRRLMRTLRPMYQIVFGDRDQALAAAQAINHIHTRVTGPSYQARDPALLLWVLATLIDTSFEVRQRFLGPMAPAEAEAYYDDAKRLGRLLQVPADVLPPDLAAFRRYFDDTIDSLRVSAEAREIAADLMRLTPTGWPAVLPLRLLSAGLLPEALRRQYGLDWGSKRDWMLRAAERLSRAVLPRLPDRLRRPPWFLMPPRR